MIQASELMSQMRRIGLDAEGADHYRDDIDLIPAINSAVDWIVATVNSELGNVKFSGEAFVDLVKTYVYTASSFSRIKVGDCWSILGIMPKPTVHPSNSVPTPGLQPHASAVMTGVSYISSYYNAARMTFEEWERNRKNPFFAGNEIQTCPELITYGYLSHADYSSTNYATAKEVEVRPSIAGQLVGVRVVKNPTPITSGADFVEFPNSMEGLIIQKSLQYIAFKQGDGTNIYTVSERDLQQQLKSFL